MFIDFQKNKKYFLPVVFLIIVFLFCYFLINKNPEQKNIVWGVNFSQKQTESLGLDWKETYSALISLGFKKIKIATYWNLIEKEEGKYNFDDLDWQIKEAENTGVKILLAIGMKTPRWPECHMPEWVKNQDVDARNQKLLEHIEKIVNRYKDSTAISVWQVENEPFFTFGECPKIEKDFIKKEISLVKSLDLRGRNVVISDSGEYSLWIKPAQLGDVVGITLYRKVWFSPLEGIQKSLLGAKKISFYVNYPLFPIFYRQRAWIIKKLFNKEVINVEFQAEPWGPGASQDLSRQEWEKTMSLDRFKKNIEFAKKTGFSEFYFWGGEWWYWLKTKQNDSSIWEEAGKMLKTYNL